MRGAWAFAVVLSFAVARAAAEPAPAPLDEASYRELIRKALRDYELGHFAESNLYFREAHALQPSARTLRGLGLTAYAVRDYVQALEHFERALANTNRPLAGSLRESVHQLQAQAERFVATLEVSLDPEGAQLAVDERPAQRGTDGRIRVNPGQHDLIATSAGRETVTRRIWVRSGERVVLQLMLPFPEPSPASVALTLPVQNVEPPPVVSPPPQDAHETPMAASIVIGASAAVAVTGGVLLVISQRDIDRLEQPRKGTSWSSVRGDYDRTPWMSAVGFGLVGLGALGAAAGVAWLYWPSSESDAVRVQLGPTGVQVGGRL
jgi:hypothetical protein